MVMVTNMARSRLLRQAAVNHNRRIHHRVQVAILLRRTRRKRVAVAMARNHRIRLRQPRRRRVRVGRGLVDRAKPIENWPTFSASFFYRSYLRVEKCVLLVVVKST